MHSFEVHWNERVCIKSGRLGLEQVLIIINFKKKHEKSWNLQK